MAAIRPVKVKRKFTKTSPGSVLYQCGDTIVLCTASIETKVPPWLVGKGTGWVTAEYNMLPGSTTQRTSRGANGRAKEIERLIGRSLRAAVDLMALGPRTLTIDCDVLQADGGTRTAAITGGWVALALGVRRLRERGLIPQARRPVLRQIAAISVGLVDGELRLDLPYKEDAAAEVDMNIVMARSLPNGLNDGSRDGSTDGAPSASSFVEVQGTGENGTFSRAQLDGLLGLAEGGVASLFQLQEAALRAIPSV